MEEDRKDSLEDGLFLYLDPEELSEDERKPKTRAIFIPFSLADEWYVVRIEDALEILKPQNITRVPGLPSFIIGVTGVRGNIVSIVDLKQFLSLAMTPITWETRIIVINASKRTTGLLVDSVQKTLSVNTDSIQPPLSTIPENRAAFIRGTVRLSDGRLVTILDMEKIMSAPQMIFE